VSYELPADFRPITLQRAFDAAWNAFVLKEGQPAMSNDECCYLTPDGRKCAIGLLIPDGHPAQKTGGKSALGLSEIYPSLFASTDLKFLAKLNELQGELHDRLAGPFGGWSYHANTQAKRKAIYRYFAKEHNLTVPGEAL
jgi:hypothetical protein